jgi:FMN phosphatase YigB (HAD superfamily)
MKSLLEKIADAEKIIRSQQIKTISFDIDGTIYPIQKAQFAWWKKFFVSPKDSVKFLAIRKKWEKRRAGNASIEVTRSDVEFFEEFLASLLDENFVPKEILNWFTDLEKRGLNIFFLSDHGAEKKLQKLNVRGEAINCLTKTGELKPHQKISEYLKSHYKILPDHHLHLGDRWTDEEQAKLLGSHFSYFILSR